MTTQAFLFQTGTNSYNVNELILFVDNTENLYIATKEIYNVARSNDLDKQVNFNDWITKRFKFFIRTAINQYRKEINHKFTMTADEKAEFIKMYVDYYPTYLVEYGLV